MSLYNKTAIYVQWNDCVGAVKIGIFEARMAVAGIALLESWEAVFQPWNRNVLKSWEEAFNMKYDVPDDPE